MVYFFRDICSVEYNFNRTLRIISNSIRNVYHEAHFRATYHLLRALSNIELSFCTLRVPRRQLHHAHVPVILMLATGNAYPLAVSTEENFSVTPTLDSIVDNLVDYDSPSIPTTVGRVFRT